MELSDEQREFQQVLITQNQQIIDILMMILKNHDEDDADIVEFAHNKKNVFLSDLSPSEFGDLYREFKNGPSDS